MIEFNIVSTSYPFSWQVLCFYLLALVSLVCTYFWLQKGLSEARVPLIFAVLNILLILIYWRALPIDEDEIEHLHCSWLVAQGLIPFRDFWQHHSPLLWVVLAPIMGLLKPSVEVFEYSRILSFAVFLLSAWIGWQIAKAVWRRPNFSLYLLVLTGLFFYGLFFQIRPDLFMLFFSLLGIRLVLMIPEGGYWTILASGFCFSMGLAFMFKQYLMLFLPPIVILFTPGNKKLRLLAVYTAGVLAGCLPLAVYLFKEHIVPDFLFWLFRFNWKFLTIKVSFPGAIFLLSAVLLIRTAAKGPRTKAFVILSLAFYFSTFNSIATIVYKENYYLQLWLLLCAIIISGYRLEEIFGKIKSAWGKAVVMAGFGMVFVMPNISVMNSNHRDFDDCERSLAQILKIAQSGSCFLIIPDHPVFVRDAVRLYSSCEYRKFMSSKEIKRDLNSGGGMVGRILAQRPQVIQRSYEGRAVFKDLIKHHIISKQDYEKRLKPFLKQNYVPEKIGGDDFYVRKDRV
ncbi:MAG: hypothetical protein KGK03_06840 [Candidatus Omnitrophica bacterium]|nr:hypothetical protein [Candidatus Omnitrophota bacterium]MDE2222770.1 hypothetical protein [Candidatus Omnitrophota bacterium]